MRNRDRLAGREGGELGRLAQTASRRVSGKRGAVRVFHVYVTSDPVAGGRDRLPRAWVARLLAFEKVQHMLSAHCRPLGKQPVVFVRQAASSADGDQTSITHLGQDRHGSIIRWRCGGVSRVDGAAGRGGGEGRVMDGGDGVVHR